MGCRGAEGGVGTVVAAAASSAHVLPIPATVVAVAAVAVAPDSAAPPDPMAASNFTPLLPSDPLLSTPALCVVCAHLSLCLFVLTLIFAHPHPLLPLITLVRAHLCVWMCLFIHCCCSSCHCAYMRSYSKGEHECTHGWPRSVPVGLHTFKIETQICVSDKVQVTWICNSSTCENTSTCHSINEKWHQQYLNQQPLTFKTSDALDHWAICT